MRGFKFDDLLKVPPSKKPCFLKGTTVETEHGLIEINKIHSGIKVLTYNFRTQSSELKQVKELYTNKAEKYIRLKTNTGDIINVTGAHRFWIPFEQKWKAASNFKIGDSFKTANAKITKVDKLDIIESIENTYNLEMEGNSNYFVGNDKILVHNASKVSKFASTELIEVQFYILRDFNDVPYYIGQTIQGIGKRYDQHKYDFKLKPSVKPWMKNIDGFKEIRLNGIQGPFKMTPYEAAVTEMYEINITGGKRKGNKGLFNKHNPIGKKKFETFKKTGSFNPCRFYV